MSAAAPLRIAVVHYHLRPGGVTRVVEHALEALRRQGVRCLVMAGEPPAGAFDREASLFLAPELAYGTQPSAEETDALLERLRAAARHVLGGPPDVWHIHNHALGKNTALPRMVAALAGHGERLLLQLHDFAEDGRPENYRFLARALADGEAERLDTLLYPLAPTVAYAVLNRRDERMLLQAGVEAARVRYLPNAVGLPDEETSRGGAPAPELPAPLYLYPTRAIRRKNLGEFLLWAAASRDGHFGVTLAPRNPAARPVYERWVALAARLGLPVQFEMASHHSFPRLLQSAHALVTTSVAEGFGMAFLEAWLSGKPLAGRDLPDITTAYVQDGMDLGALYPRLLIPEDWVNLDTLRDTVRTTLTETRRAYGRPTRGEDVEAAFDACRWAGRLEFGHLEENMQETIIQRIHTSPSAARELDPPALLPAGPGADIEANRRCVRENYGLETYGRRLAACYRELASAPSGLLSWLPADRLLERFLDPSRFLLLRT